jgi:hypothetical protein
MTKDRREEWICPKAHRDSSRTICGVHWLCVHCAECRLHAGGITQLEREFNVNAKQGDMPPPDSITLMRLITGLPWALHSISKDSTSEFDVFRLPSPPTVGRQQSSGMVCSSLSLSSISFGTSVRNELISRTIGSTAVVLDRRRS